MGALNDVTCWAAEDFRPHKGLGLEGSGSD